MFNRGQDAQCESCETARSATIAPLPEVWHFDEDRGACVPATAPHRCPDHACRFYDAPPPRVDDVVTGHDSIAEMRAVFHRLVGGIGKPGAVEPEDLEQRRATLRAQARQMLAIEARER